MLLDSFEVENFRSLKHLKLEKLARVNLLVGKNNSGKTSVLEALYALTRIEVPDWLESLEENRGIEAGEQDLSLLFYEFNPQNIIQILVCYREVGVGAKSFKVRLDLVNESNAKARRRERKALLVSIGVGAKTPYRLVLSHRDDEAEYIPQTNAAEVFMEKGLPDTIVDRHDAEFLVTTINLNQLSDQISTLKTNKKLTPLLDIMRQIDPRIVDLSLDSKGQINFDLKGNFAKLTLINLLGEGVQRLLCVVASMATIEGGIVLIDEIDNGLHYSALRILWKGILQAARDYDVQVFATTHSAEALRHLTWVLDEEENKDYREDVATYTLIRADDDKVRSYRYGYSQLEFALERGVEVRN